MKPKTNPPRVTAPEMAGLLDRSEERLRQLVRAGTLPSPVRGKYAPVSTLSAWAKYLEARLGEKHDGGKARISAARASLLEFRLERERGFYIHQDEVRRDCTRVFGELKSQLCTIPRRLASSLAMETDVVAVEEKIQAEIFGVLAAVSSGEKARNLLTDGKPNSENPNAKTDS